MLDIHQLCAKKSNNYIKRGEIYMCDLPKEDGSVQSNYRPVLVIQNDIGNRFSPTSIIAPISKKFKPMPTHVRLNVGIGGMIFESFVLCEQIRTIDKKWLSRYVGRLELDSEIFKQVEHTLLLSLGFK